MDKKQLININGIDFTKQEVAVINEIKNGESNRVIANKLGLSVKAIEYHIKNIKDKISVDSKDDAILFFMEKGKEERNRTKYYCLNNKKFLQSLVVILSVLLVSILLFYPRNKQFLEVTNVSNFTGNFLDRPFIENKIVQKLKNQTGIRSVVIFGMGGAGKTTISRKVLSMLEGNIKFEVNAETEKTLYNSFMELADNLASNKDQRREIDIIRNLDDPVYRRRRLVRIISSMLKEKGGWVLLMDNVGSFESIREYFPANEEIWGCGNVLITTRNQNLQDNNFVKKEYMLEIGKLEDLEKKELFSEIVYNRSFLYLSQETQKKVSEFLTMIPEFPLDVCATAYYVKNTHISLSEYSKLLSERIKDLNRAQRDLMRENSGYNETRYGIISSSFKEILKNKKEYKLLLLALSLFDSQNIPKDLLKNIGGTINTDNFIHQLRSNSLVLDTGDEISIHRSNHRISYDYIIKNLSQEELSRGIQIITDVVFEKGEVKLAMIPHLESILSKISKFNGEQVIIAKSKLLLLKTEILKSRSYRTLEAEESLKLIFDMNKDVNYLDKYFFAKVQYKMGEIYTDMNQNSLARKYLQECLLVLHDHDVEKIKAFMMLGVVLMRQQEFDQANKNFIKALENLHNIKLDTVKKKVLEANIYESMSFNYFMDGINRENARIAVNIMKKAIKVLDDPKLDVNESVVSSRGVQQVKLAGIYNALAWYQKALDLAQSTENMINKSGYDNADTLYVRGIIARERGLSNLRLNRVSLAYKYFEQARLIFSKMMKGDYLFKLKIHEVECLVRLDRLDKAIEICENIFEEKERERNNYSDLFYTTGLYHAAVIEFKRQNYEASERYFKSFFKNVKILCRDILTYNVFKDLDRKNVFNEHSDSLQLYFENSLKVFEAIYWKDYEFTKYYVEKNLDLASRWNGKL